MQNEHLFPVTTLVPVKDWDWCRYVARYWRDQQHCDTGESPLLEREFIDSDPDRFLCGNGEPEGGWPVHRWQGKPGYVSWQVLEQDVAGRLRFVTAHGMGGIRVEGAGWLTPLPEGWLGI